jgi:6-phosphogluconolactonase
VTGPDGSPDVRVLPDLAALSDAAAAWVADALRDSAAARGRASFVLSGGSTPKGLYERLATRFTDRVPWRQVHAFWSDERYVPHDDRLSNYRMARGSLLDQVPIPADQVHPMPTHLPVAGDAARAYEAVVTEFFAGGPPIFDVLLLGLGADGHTASVFAGSPALTSSRVAVAVTAPADPPERLTLTLPVLARGRRVGVLVAGASKAAALAASLSGRDPNLPGAVLARSASTLVWWVDRDAWPSADLKVGSTSKRP